MGVVNKYKQSPITYLTGRVKSGEGNLFNKLRHFDYINKLIFVCDYDRAYYLLDNMLFKDGKITDRNFIYHLRLIELSIKLGKIDVLIEKYEYTCGEDTEFHSITMNFIDLFTGRKNPQECLKLFKSFILTSNKYLYAIYYGCGICLSLVKQSSQSIEYFNKSVDNKSDFYPSYFGLSQIYFNTGDISEGNKYFYMFESLAKYNVYGNFETHSQIASEFLKYGKYDEARTAINLLTKWWEDNKGYCPLEIGIYENFFISNILKAQGGREEEACSKREQAVLVAKSAVKVIEKEEVLFFVATILENNNCLELALEYYEKILKVTSNSSFIQKVGAYFVSEEDFKNLKQLFDKAYEYNPDSPQIKFYKLVSDLHESGVDIGEYLSKKEMMLRLYTDEMMDYKFNMEDILFDKIREEDSIENFLRLESIFDKDPDIQRLIAALYERKGDFDNSFKHYKKMLSCDPKSWGSLYAYVSFLLKHTDLIDRLDNQTFEKMFESLNAKHVGKKEKIEINYLASSYYYTKGDYDKSDECCKKILSIDSWSYQAIMRRILNISKRLDLETQVGTVEPFLFDISKFDLSKLEDFDKRTSFIESLNHYELSYYRRKLSFLISNGDSKALDALVQISIKFDPRVAIYDFMKLVNTNFDSPKIYLAIGLLHKELWQLETALCWFYYYLENLDGEDSKRSKAYMCIADCLVYLGQDLDKALEYAKLCLELDPTLRFPTYTLLSHINLKLGNIKEAKKNLVEVESVNNVELTYLRGLLQYRNGKVKEAKSIWKPLINKNSSTVKEFHIKETMMSYYFDKKEYPQIKTNNMMLQ